MKFKMIDIKQFYLIASILMTISVAGQIWNLTNVWWNITTGARISSLAGGVLFQTLLAVFFIGLWKMTPKMDNKPVEFDSVIDDGKLDKLLKEMNDNVVN